MPGSSSSPSPGPTRCTPAACTRPAAARRRASALPHGHQANASGGSSSASGVSSSGSAGSQPATTTVGRGGPIGRTATWTPEIPWAPWVPWAPWAPPPRTVRPPAAPKPSRAARSASSGSATNVSPTVASATREPGALTGATGRASTGSPGSPGPNSSSTVMPSARARPRATRSEGSEWPDSTADTACLVTPATPASCCWDRPRACRASRSRVPSGWETLRHVPTSPSRVTCSLPYGASRELHAWPGASGTTTLSHRRGPDHHDAALPWFGSARSCPASGVTAFTAPVIGCRNTPDQGYFDTQ